MTNQMMSDILRSIVAHYSPALKVSHESLADHADANQSLQRLSEAIKSELRVTVTLKEMESSNWPALVALVESRMNKNRSGQTLLNIYRDLGTLAREEYHPKIPYEWCAKWNDFLNVWVIG